MKQSHLYHGKLIDKTIKLNKSMIDMLEYYNPDRNIAITLNVDKCILIYPAQRWKVIETRLLEIPNAVGEMMLFQRHLLGHMFEGTFDKAGVVKLPDYLIERAGIDKDISILEMNNKIEIWDKKEFEKEIELLDGKKRYKLYGFFNDVLDIQHKETISKIIN